MMRPHDMVFEGLYFDEAGIEISPAELLERAKPIPVWNADGEYIGEVLRVHRNADHCLEALIEGAT